MSVLDQVTDLADLFNRFLRSMPKEDQTFISEYFILFLKSGDAARRAPAEVQQKIGKF